MKLITEKVHLIVAINTTLNMQQSQLIYMDVGPSISEPKQTWIEPDDDRVEYATVNHQHLRTENQPVHDSSTIGESQIKTIRVLFQHALL